MDLIPDLPTRLSAPDLAIVALYLVAITLFGLRFRKKGEQSASLQSYFLADNTIPWWAIALSIVSAETSTLTIISIPGVAFAGDLGFLQVVLGYMLGRVVVAWLFLPRYFAGQMLTAYQLIDRRFGPALHKLTAGLFLLTRAAAEGVRVFAISIVVGIAIGTGDILSIAIISALTLLYTFEGGMAAVIWTDVVQMALYVAGTLVALWSLAHHVPGGWQHIHAVAAPLHKFNFLNFTLNLTTAYTFWAGLLGGTFLTMASHGTDQLMVQRMLAARNLRESRLALLSSGVVIFIQFLLFLLIGVGLFVFYSTYPHNFPSPDRIFPTFIVQEMPRGIAGLLVAAILAAAMSNLSAALNSLASTTVIDFILPLRNRAQNTTLLSRAATVFWALVLFAIAVYAIQHGGKGHVVETGLSIASVAYGCLLGVFLLGTLTTYATQTGAILGMITGLALNLYLWQFTHVAFTWYVLIGAAATFAIGTLFSLLLPSRSRRSITTAIVLLLCLSSFAAGGGPAFAQPTTPPPAQTYDFSPADTLIQDAIAAHKLPGAVLLVGHNNRIVYQHAYGLRRYPGEPTPDAYTAHTPTAAANAATLADAGEPMTLDTIFDMASLTKVIVTTTAILQLYEQGKIDLDTPLAHYLPAFATSRSSVIPSERSEPRNPRISPAAPPMQNEVSSRAERESAQPRDPRISSSPAPQILAWKSRITIRNLLTHYSGLPEDVNLKDDWGLAAPDKAEGIRRALSATPYGPPGVTFKYSDINFILLGALVEKLSGEPLDDYAQEHIFVPLAMSNTRYFGFYCSCSRPKPPAYDGLAPPPPPPAPNSDAEKIMLGKCLRNICTIIPWRDTAPTAHDDQGTPATNPNYDHLLRGTVHDPTTRRMGGVAGHAGLFSTAADMSLFCQALLDKLTHNTGPFPLKQSTLQLATSPQAPATAVTTAAIFLPDGTPTKGVAQRGLGWDINSPFSRPRGTIFPTLPSKPASFGHTGFTGTSLWLDPTSNTYVILLANAIHPRGNATISPLRGQVATAIAQALGLLQSSPDGHSERSSEAAQPKNPHDLRPATAHQGSQPQTPPRPSPAASLQRVAYRSPAHLPGAPFIAPSAMSGPSSEARPTSPQLVPASFPRHLPGAPGLASETWVSAQTPSLPTLTGIDTLQSTNFQALTDLAKTLGHPVRLGLLTNASARDSRGIPTYTILAHPNPAFTLNTIFTPEHGLNVRQDTEHLAPESAPTPNIPIVSLYGPKRSDKHPRQSDLKPLDAILLDLPDAGVPFWTYETLTGYMLEACAQAKVPLFVLDRPNPIGGIAVQGPTADPGSNSYLSFSPIPIRHGLTLGELARYFNDYASLSSAAPGSDPESVQLGSGAGASATGSNITPPATRPGLHAALTVIPLQNWTRAEYFASTGLTWTPPSPNLRTPATSIVYPGVAMLEFNPVSVGRGTASPYETFGAPYIKADELAAYLNARHIPAVHFTATTLAIAETPEHYPFHGQTIPGIRVSVSNPALLDSPEMGIELLSALHHLYPADFHVEKAKTILLNAATLEALRRGTDPRDIAATWQHDIAAFRQARTPYLLYR